MIRLWRRRTEAHPSEETLLLHLEGELHGPRTRAVERHLRECWQCRALAHRFDSAVHAFLEQRRDYLQSAAGQGASAPSFRDRLRQWAATQPPQAEKASMAKVSLRRLWPFAFAAAALASVEAWKPVIDWLAPVPAVHDVIRRSAPPNSPPTRVVTWAPGGSAPAPRPSVIGPIPAAPTLGPAAADLDAAELETFAALHRAGLCRGHDVGVLRVPGCCVRVVGVVDHLEQRSNLEALLAGIAFVELAVLAPPGEDVATALPAPPQQVRLEPRRPWMHDRLVQHFKQHASAGQVARAANEFANQAVLLAASARWEAQALRKLAVAFPARRLREMPSSSRARVLAMVEEHRSEIERSLAELGRMLDQLEDPAAPLVSSPSAGAWPGWDERFAQLERVASLVDLLVNGLFAGLELPGYDAAGAWAELRRAHSETILLAGFSASALAAAGEIQATTLPEASTPPTPKVR